MDANQHTTSWTYDNMDRVATRTDPLLRPSEGFSYDVMGNLVSSTDRKGQVTSLSYDPLNRLTLAGYNTVVTGGVTSYESTTAYTYDAGNRMTQAVDSAGGTITDAYDDLDRLSSETTPQGSISYGYDLAGRRTSMTVAGQPQVTYTYDSADKLTQIAQGSTTVGFGYDDANRRSTLTLSNGVNISYSYDNNSRVTGITYNFGANLLGNLTYSYDSLGRRTQVGGSFSRTGFPGAVTSASYDAANELTTWNGTPISYDLNGNMQSDGTNTFAWNARNQVATLNGRNLQYDAYGRRIQNQLGTAFLYDGANAAQELAGGTATANLLSGGIDEWFSRSDSSGTVTPLQDALGSTIALVDASGNIATAYSYDPFGNTTSAELVSSNPSQYTGRENEGNGLYFYRARYYSPLLGRFINEDPLGFTGGDFDLYKYAADNPVNFIDPSGLTTTVYFWPSTGGIPGSRNFYYGHVSMSISGSNGSAYISWQPLATDNRGNGTVGFEHYDTIEHGVAWDTMVEGDRQPQVITIEGLDEKAMLAWWKQYKTDPRFSIVGRNCSTTVRKAFQKGGADTAWWGLAFPRSEYTEA